MRTLNNKINNQTFKNKEKICKNSKRLFLKNKILNTIITIMIFLIIYLLIIIIDNTIHEHATCTL